VLKSTETVDWCGKTRPVPRSPVADAGTVSSARIALNVIARTAPSGLVSVREASSALELSGAAASAVLSRLTRQGWLTRVRRGLYAVRALEARDASSVPVDDAWVLASRVFRPCYVGGWTAAEHWELTEQIFRPTFVVTSAAARRSTVHLGGVEFRVAHVEKRRIAGAVLVWRGRERVAVSSRERTIADALRNPTWIGGVRHLARVLSAYKESDAWNRASLLDAVAKQGRGVAWKRLGKVVESLFPDEHVVIKRALAERSAGVVKLDPSVRARGGLDKRWGLWVNVDLHGPETAA
jgi:predicted transcriptional regulator of viral defense system